MTPFEEFAARLMKLYWEHDGYDLDGAAVQELAIEAGIIIERQVTQEEIDGSKHMQE